VQPVLPKLIERLKRATEARGSKAELAAWLGVHRQSVTDWLSGKQEPGGEITLRLLTWVEQQERQK
jgi:DNA-binding transcriptional regulator YiaG